MMWPETSGREVGFALLLLVIVSVLGLLCAIAVGVVIGWMVWG